jgi:hypothetical protein
MFSSAQASAFGLGTSSAVQFEALTCKLLEALGGNPAGKMQRSLHSAILVSAEI